VLLLHGWLASGGLNWIRAFEPLSRDYALHVPDLPGHAHSTPSDADGRFEIERSADDMAALLERVSPGRPAIVVGYSLGGMVAQALWRRHPERVAGLVLGATSAAPLPRLRSRRPFAGVAQAAGIYARILEGATRLPRAAADRLRRLLPPPLARLPRGHWAAREFSRHHWPTVLDAGRAIAHFDARDWIAEVDVPTQILLTEHDGLIPAEQQHALAQALPHAHVRTLDSGHFACVRPDFGEILAESCRALTHEAA